jgi:hypothetical protein
MAVTAVVGVVGAISVLAGAGASAYGAYKAATTAEDAKTLAENQQKQLQADKEAVTNAANEYAMANGIAVENMRKYDQALADNINAAIAQYESTIADLQKDFGISMDDAQAAYKAASEKTSAEAYADSKTAIDAMSRAVAEEAASYSSKIINGWDEPVLDADGNPVLNEDGTPKVNHVNGVGENKAEIDAIIDAYATKQGASIAAMGATMSSANEKLATDAAAYMNDYQQRLDDMAANSATQSAAVQAAYKSAIDAREAKVSGFVETFSQSAGEVNATAQAAIKAVTDKYAEDTGAISAGLAKSLNDLNESMSAKGEQITADLKVAIDQGNQALQAANAELGTAEQQVGAQAGMAAGQSAVISEAAGQQAGNVAQQAARQSGMAGQAAGLMGATEAAKAQREAFMGALESNRAAAQQAQQARLQAQQLAAQTGMDQAQALAAVEEAQRTGDFSQISANLNTGAQTQLDTAKNAADMQNEQMRIDQQAELDRMREELQTNVSNANQSGADAVHAADTMSSENQQEANRQATAQNAFFQAQLEQAREEQRTAFEAAVKKQEEASKADTETKNSKIDSIESAMNTAIGAARETKDDKMKAAESAAQKTLQTIKERSDTEKETAANSLASETNQANTALTSGMAGASTTAGQKIGEAATEHQANYDAEMLALSGEKEKSDAAKANMAAQSGVAINSSNNAASTQNAAAQAAQQFGTSLIGGASSVLAAGATKS